MNAFGSAKSFKDISSHGRLGKMIQDVRYSAKLWSLLAPALPSSLRDSLQGGAWNQKTNTWTLIAPNPAIANKCKNLVPDMLAHLLTHGHSLTKIDIHIRQDEEAIR